MNPLGLRALLDFPSSPSNSSFTRISGVDFNLTTLKLWKYAYYSNGTLSNNSWCVLAFNPYTPASVLENGTFINNTSCYTPVYPIATRGYAGIGLAIYFAIGLMFNFINLRKHGRTFLPVEKRFHPVGRRWQWYWMIVVAACAMACGIGSIDIDRYYLPEFPIVLSNLGYFMMVPAMIAAVWESVRHWASWQERQIVDPNPYALKIGGRRDKVEFYLPLVFYTFCFMNFFMTVPRSWNEIEAQRSPEQTAQVAKPAATDGRFIAGAIFIFISWLVICYCLRHSIHYYKPRNRGIFNSFLGFFSYTPIRFLVSIPLSFVLIGYQFALAFKFWMSPLNITGNIAYIYGLGWGPVCIIYFVYQVYGYIDPNEDAELIHLRRVRSAEVDAEMGYTRKPNWWRRLHGDWNLSLQDAIANNVTKVRGGNAGMAATGNGDLERTIEMDEMPASSPGDAPPRYTRSTPLSPFSDIRQQHATGRGRNIPSEPADGGHSERSSSTTSGTTLNAPPQQIRSMLDV